MRVTEIGAWPGGTVVDLAVDGETVLAATFAGIYRSTDGGQSWSAVGKELPDWFIQAVLLAPMDGQTVAIAASHAGWLYRSVDGGETWDVVSSQSSGVVTRLAASPSFAQDGVMFACTEEDGIFKSVDRGRTWHSANFGVLNLSVLSLCFSPNFENDEVAFAGTDGGGLFRSRNAGRAWRESGEGLPDSAVQCLVVSPSYDQDGVVFAGTEDQGLYRSDDKGVTWKPACDQAGDPGQEGALAGDACINALYLAPDWATGGQMVAATDDGFLVSTDGGRTWKGVGDGPEFPYTVERCGDGYLAGAYDTGVYRSADAAVWETSNAGIAAHLPPAAFLSEAFASDRAVVMASMEGTGVRSTDGGQTWKGMRAGEDEAPFSLLAGTGEGAWMTLLSGVENMVFCSRDGGASWNLVTTVGEDSVSAVCVAPGSGANAQPQLLVGTMGGRVLFSGDGGQSWAQQAAIEGAMVTAIASAGDRMYVVTARQQEGGGWRLSLYEKGVPEPILSREANEPVTLLDLQDDGGLYCAMGGRVLCVEAGQVVAEGEMEDALPVSGLGVKDGVVLAGTRSGLYRSLDRAQSWEQLTPDVQAVALRVVSPDKAYAAAMGGRLWEIELA